MKDRSGIQGVASNPVLVGAVTVLVILVAVFLAYNANNGLPFVSTYDLKARVPNAQALVKGNEVRIGGARVGVVKAVKPIELKNENCTPNERDALSARRLLRRRTQPQPRQDRRPGAGQLDPGHPAQVAARPQVRADRPRRLQAGLQGRRNDPDRRRRAPNRSTSTNSSACSTKRPATAIRKNEAGFGNAFAGRGPQLNAAFGSLRKLAESAQEPLANLVAPSTNFGGFWRALEALNATVAPVAEINGTLFVALDRTFAAFARVSRPFIQETISKGPETLDTAIEDLPAIDPFLESSERFFTAFKPGAAALADSSPILNAAEVAGIPVLKASPVFNAQLEPTADALLAFQEAPGVFNGLDLLIDTNEVLEPGIRFIGPAQYTCNYLTLAFGNVADALSESNGQANWAGALALEPPSGPEQRGRRRLGPRQRPRTRQPPPLQPVPEHRLAGPDRMSARPATSPTKRARR